MKSAVLNLVNISEKAGQRFSIDDGILRTLLLYPFTTGRTMDLSSTSIGRTQQDLILREEQMDLRIENIQVAMSDIKYSVFTRLWNILCTIIPKKDT